MAIKFAIKVVITSTAIYWTNQLEVWSKLSPNERTYDQLISCAKKYIQQNTPEAMKLQVQKVQDDRLLLCATSNYYYNQGVMNTFGFLSNLPQQVGGLYDKVVEQLDVAQKNAEQTKPAQ